MSLSFRGRECCETQTELTEGEGVRLLLGGRVGQVEVCEHERFEPAGRGLVLVIELYSYVVIHGVCSYSYSLQLFIKGVVIHRV